MGEAPGGARVGMSAVRRLEAAGGRHPAHWRTGALAHWRTGALTHWRTGALAHWRACGVQGFVLA